MNGNWDYIKENIEAFPEYKSAIFEQGFVMTNQVLPIGEDFPFFGNWRRVEISSEVNLYLHCNQKAYLLRKNGVVYFLLGHAYDPFSYEKDENILLENAAGVSEGVFEKAIPVINDWTGLFTFGIIDQKGFSICGDFESMRTTYYGAVNGKWYIASHEELIAWFTPLTPDEYVCRLEHYRWYHLYGEGLPADVCHYHELKKLMCNTFVVFKNGAFDIKRLYPDKPLIMCSDENDYRKTVEAIAAIMKASLELSAEKWPRAAVSVTGGRDSKGSLAAASHLGDKLQYFSYNSQYAEQVDCEAAEKICEAVGVKHTTYNIPLDKDIYPEYDLAKAIMMVNSNRLYFNHNDVMKRIYFRKMKPFDVEIKSWTSEIGRGYYYKRYGVKRMQRQCNARRTNVMNNIYLFNPRLMYQTDKRYRDYLKKTQYNERMFNYDWTDIIELEMRDSRWGTDVISCEHMFCYDITIPYNNRNLGDLFLSVPLNDRIKDRTHIDFINLLCPAVEKEKINVKDYSHDERRMWLDKIYYFFSCIRPL